MKKILILTVLILAFAFPALAADVVQTNNGYASYSHNQDLKTATFTVTADGAGDVAIFTFLKPGDIAGYHLFTVEMYSATDDAFTTLIYTNTGSTLFTHTTTAATSGEIQNAADRWPIYDAPKIDVTGLTATEVATIIVSFER